jgi:hypothetical protein
MGFVDLVWHTLFLVCETLRVLVMTAVAVVLVVGRQVGVVLPSQSDVGRLLSKHCFRCIPLGTIGETEMKMNRGCARWSN